MTKPHGLTTQLNHIYGTEVLIYPRIRRRHMLPMLTAADESASGARAPRATTAHMRPVPTNADHGRLQSHKGAAGERGMVNDHQLQRRGSVSSATQSESVCCPMPAHGCAPE